MGLSPALRDRAETHRSLPTLGPEISGKRLELLKETVPKLSRVWRSATPTGPCYHRVLQIGARKAFDSVELQFLERHFASV